MSHGGYTSLTMDEFNGGVAEFVRRCKHILASVFKRDRLVQDNFEKWVNGVVHKSAGGAFTSS
jgi:hypothetical protein